MRIFERIFKRKHIAKIEAENEELKKKLEFIKSGVVVPLTENEKKLIKKAIETSEFKASVEEPRTAKFVRIVRNNVREKIRFFLKEEEREANEHMKKRQEEEDKFSHERSKE